MIRLTYLRMALAAFAITCCTSAWKKTGCVSCHQNSLTALAVSTARENGFAVDEAIAARQVKATAAYVDTWRDRSFQGLSVAGGQDSVSYIVMGLAV